MFQSVRTDKMMLAIKSKSNNQSFENHIVIHLEYLVSRQGFKILDVESDGNCF